ncbi:MAG: putative DNA binding domain-containing protein [Ruminiclostridium sp.]|nr:putative DNA binding domain-containing protein [Ruminiclostridium sp.]
MTEQEILELLKYGEHIHLECKKAESKIPNSVWETYSSFANTDGGLILFGVEEHIKEVEFDKRFSFMSVKNPDQRIKDIWNTINNDKVSSNILVDANVGTCVVKNELIIWINVPRAKYNQKPIYLNGNPMKGSFKRNHEGDYHCTEEEVKAMLRDANDTGSDGGILDGYTMEDIDINALRSYRIEFEHNNPDHVWNSLQDIDFLQKMGGYTKDRSTGKSWLTSAGLLMFGKGDVLRERFANIRMDYLDKTNLLSGSRWSDRLTYDGMWENNLYNFMRQVMPKLVSDIKRPFKLSGMKRIDDTPVHKAIREAVVNMMIHSDYMITGVLKIEKTEKGFFFSNPGNLKLPVKDIYDGGHSVARNPRIQTFFRMIGAGDNIGSGFPTILEAWGEEKWRKPDLRENEDLNVVELKLWTISLMPKECTDYLQNLFGIAYNHLSRNEQIILGTAYLENSVTNNRLQSIIDLHSSEIGHILAGLVEKNMLITDNKGRWTCYQLNKGYVIQPEQVYFSDNSVEKIKFKTDTDRLIYEYAKENGFITTAQAVQISPNISTRQGASMAINRLINNGFLQKSGKGKKTIYKFIR